MGCWRALEGAQSIEAWPRSDASRLAQLKREALQPFARSNQEQRFDHCYVRQKDTNKKDPIANHLLMGRFQKAVDRSVDRFFFVVVLGTLERVRLFSYLHSNGPSKQNIYRPKHLSQVHDHLLLPSHLFHP